MSHRTKARSSRRGKQWAAKEVQDLRKQAPKMPTRLIADRLRRSPGAIYAKASEEGISLKPTNQSPYNRRRKK